MTDPFGLGTALAFDLHAQGATPTDGWRPLAERISEPALRQRIEHVRNALTRPGCERVDARTAASTEQFGLAARIVAAHICAASLGISADLRATALWCREDRNGWLQLSVAQSSAPPNPLQDTAIDELTDRIQHLYGVSSRVLWGNIGSAANSTLALLRTTRADLVSAAREAADQVLADPRVDGGTLRTGPQFRRTSCCLIYRATESLCGDCVLRRAPADRT